MVDKNILFVEKIVSVLKNEGFISLVRKAFKKTIYRKRSFVYIKYDMRTPLKQYKTSTRWKVDAFTPRDIPRCRTYFSRHMSDYVDFFNDGLKAYAAYEVETSNVVGIIWYVASDFYDKHYLRCRFPVKPYQVLQFAGEMALPYRNTPISVNIMQSAYAYWQEQGKDEVFCYTDVTNVPSLRLHFHVGWEEMGQLIHIHRFLGYQWQKMETYSGERFAQFKKRSRNKAPA